MKKIKKAVLLAVGIALLVSVLAVVINLPVFDEKLRPEVEAIKNRQAQAFQMNNAHPAILAIHREENDLLEAAATIRRLLNEKIASTGLDYFNEDEINQYVDTKLDKEWLDKYRSCNSRRDQNCLTDVMKHLQEQPIKDSRLKQQLAKYQQLLAYDDYSDAVQLDFSAPLPPYGTLMKLKRIYLVNSYLNDGPQVFLEKVNQDLQFWYMWLEKSHLLLMKMIAIASIHDSVGLLSMAVAEHKLTVEQLSEVQSILPIIDVGALNISGVMDAEFKGGIAMYDEAERNGDFKYLKVFDFYQPNASHNLAYAMLEPSRKLAKLEAPEFYQTVNEPGFGEEVKYSFGFTPASFYNPIGKMLVSYSLAAYSDYIARFHDLNGMITLLKLQIELALQPDSAVSQVINPSKYVNPYTREPMSYNAETNTLYFECIEKSSVCELAL